MSGLGHPWGYPSSDAGTAIEHTAVCRLRGRAHGPPIVKNVYSPMPITPGGKGRTEMHAVKVKQMAKDVRPGERVDSYFSVSYKKPVTEYRNGHMFEVRVADSSGQLTVKYWGDRDREAVQRVYSSFDKDDVVRVTGTSSEYRGQVEVSVSREGGGTISRMEDGTYDASALISAVEDIPGKRERLTSRVSEVEEPHVRALLESFFGDEAFMEAFSKAPASIQLHGAAVGGLLQHTLNVVDNAMEAVRQHPELDRDLVLAGALLHDIGKVRTFRVTTNINATVEGNLLGHIVIGDEELMAHVSAMDGFPADLALKLRHILLAHFGKREWGSPVEPMTPEALAVHEADDTDAKLEYMIARRRDAVTEDDWVWDGRLGRLIYLR